MDVEVREHQRQYGVVRGLALGQVLALIMSLMAVLSKLLVDNYQFSTPALQNAFGYFATCVLSMIPYSIQKSNLGSGSGFAWKLFALFLIAVADSQASFVGNLAFRYRVTVSSAGMLSSFTIPCVMFLSFIFLSSRYSKLQISGVILALLGLSVVFVADSAMDSSNTSAGATTSTSSLFGDILILLSSATYAISNVVSEGYVKAQDVYEYLLWLSLFGFAISALQFAFTEVPLRKAELKQVSHVEATFAAYAVLFALFYYVTAKFLSIYDSVALNLSLLTTGFWGMILGRMIFHEEFSLLKICGYVAVIIGATLYHSVLKAVERHDTHPLLRSPRSSRRSSYGSAS